MVKNTSITRTCSSCGQQKPLAAFLQLAGAQGGMYGSICSTCRKAGNISNTTDKDSDDTESSKIKHTLDYKMKLADEIDKKQRWKELEENYYKERELDEEKKNLKDEKKESSDKDERKHRKEKENQALSKRSLFDNRARTPQQSFVPPEQVSGGVQQLAKEREIDVSAAVDTQKARYESPFFKLLQEWVGEGGIVTQADKAARMAKRTGLDKKTQGKEETLPETAQRIWPGGRGKSRP